MKLLEVVSKYQTGTRLVLDWYQTGSDWYQTGTRLVPDWYQIGTRLVPDWRKNKTSPGMLSMSFHDVCRFVLYKLRGPRKAAPPLWIPLWMGVWRLGRQGGNATVAI